MSAGQSLRRGYAYGVHTPTHASRATHRGGEYDGAITLGITAAVSALIVALLSNQVVLAALGRLLGSLWFR